MGQYHILVNWDKKEYVHPHEIGLGLKQAEQLGNIHASMGDILYLLLSISNDRGGGDVPSDGIEHLLGRWAGDRVYVAGDYAEPGDIHIPYEPNAFYAYTDLHENSEDWTNISKDVCLMIEKVWGIRVSGDGWRDRKVVSGRSYLGPWDSEEKSEKHIRPDMVIGFNPSEK